MVANNCLFDFAESDAEFLVSSSAFLEKHNQEPLTYGKSEDMDVCYLRPHEKPYDRVHPAIRYLGRKLRVDGVLMRLRDTRMYCRFARDKKGKPIVLRETCWREATFEGLSAGSQSGFEKIPKPNSEMQ
ncbi:hypothetical protein ACLOJK_038232 [Asimina triloba]